MTVTFEFEVNKCEECPYYGNRYEYGTRTNYCKHKNASGGKNGINCESAYLNVGVNRLPEKSISVHCPARKEIKQ